MRLNKKLKLLTLSIVLSINVSAKEQIVIDGSTTVGPIAKALTEYFKERNPEINIVVSESGSGNGAKSLINKACDIADMSRFMKTKEFKVAINNNVTPVAHMIALDGLPIIVNPANSIDNLTTEQIRDIYLGKITNWKELGGVDKKIIIISRDTNSGTYETFNKLIMKKQKISGNCEYVGSNGAIRQRVQTTLGAIGYAGLGFVDDTVKALKINNIYPNAQTVSTGIYPISRPLFMFTNGYPKLGSALYKFITLPFKKDGQEIIESIGFISVTEY